MVILTTMYFSAESHIEGGIEQLYVSVAYTELDKVHTNPEV